MSWHAGRGKKGCWFKIRRFFYFTRCLGFINVSSPPLFSMFHYSCDQFWQPKQNLIWTVYSLNEWSSHLLTSLSILPETCPSTSGRTGCSCQNVLNSIIKTGAKEVNLWLLIFQVLFSLSIYLNCSEMNVSSLLGRLQAMGSLCQRQRKKEVDAQRIPRKNILKPLPEMKRCFILFFV